MPCRRCGTRIAPGRRTCPNCGMSTADPARNEAPSPARLPAPGASTARDDEVDVDVDLELDEVTEEEIPPPEEPVPAPEPPAPRRSPAGAPLFAPDPAGLRALLAEQPEALEEGLGVYRDDEGRAVGAGYATDVGEIDLLAQDAQGQLVVVLISEKGQGEELVAEALQRMGWVRKHLGGPGRRVRGVVLCERAPEGLSYAAAAVADTVSFKSYRVALRFDDIEL